MKMERNINIPHNPYLGHDTVGPILQGKKGQRRKIYSPSPTCLTRVELSPCPL